MSQLFASGGQSIGVTASTSVLPMNKSQLIPSSLGNQIYISLVGRKEEVGRSRPDEGERPESSQTCRLTLESRAAERPSNHEGRSQADYSQGAAWLPYFTHGGIHNPSSTDSSQGKSPALSADQKYHLQALACTLSLLVTPCC